MAFTCPNNSTFLGNTWQLTQSIPILQTLSTYDMYRNMCDIFMCLLGCFTYCIQVISTCQKCPFCKLLSPPCQCLIFFGLSGQKPQNKRYPPTIFRSPRCHGYSKGQFLKMSSHIRWIIGIVFLLNQMESAPMALVRCFGPKTPWFHQALQRSSVVTDPKNPQLVKLSSGVLVTVRVLNLNTPLGK